MSQQNIYQVQLLNDLHNYFPDVLYNPGRFRNIQDLLEYIREVANTSPFNRGQTIYNNRQNTRLNTGPTVGAAAAGGGAGAAGPTTRMAPVMTAIFEDNIPGTRIRVPLNTLNTPNTTMLVNTLLGGMFGDLLGVAAGGGGGEAGLQGFLNQRVPVYPTAQEIERATTLFRVNRHQDDICAICQDEIDINQEIRQIDHCSHLFHRDCIDTWFQANVHCPTCRHDIRDVANTTNINRNNRDNNRDNNDTNQNSPPPVPDNHRRMNIHRNN